jgi:guanine deaminase
MGDLRGKALLGSFLHAPVRGEIDAIEDGLVAIGEDGRIGGVWRRNDSGYEERMEQAAAERRLVVAPAGSYVLPGLVDLHVHAPQYPQLGQALDVPLEVWLQKHTFPLEARYADLGFARESYEALVGDLLANGTTTALYFATVHQAATRLLVDICLARGQRALVGKVAMDAPDACPDYYRDASAAAAIAGTRELIDYVQNHAENAEARVLPVITPRFIPSCSDEALAGLGALARETGCHVQTHCSESDWEHGHVLARHGMTDTASLDRFGLMTRRTVLAHSNFINDPDMELIAARGAGVAHCPLSNAYFANAVFPLRAALEKGVRVGLGTDISGGPSASLFENARMAVAASRMLEGGVDPQKPAEGRGRPGSRIDLATAFHLATAGGGDVLDLPIGRFESGCHFDAMLIDPAGPAGTLRMLGVTTPQEALAKIVYTASRANITNVWVSGRAAGD